MPYVKRICGIYAIRTPNGSTYVGSSTHVYHRWSEHRHELTRGTHHSSRLQKAYEIHGSNLLFELLEECAIDQLLDREQHWIDTLGAKLNVASDVRRPCHSEESKQKRIAAWRATMAKRGPIPSKRRVAVECSDGQAFSSITEAALAFDVDPSFIAYAVRQQHVTRFGVRFRRSGDEWRETLPQYGKAVATRRTNNERWFTDETRAKMRANRKGWKPTPQARAALVESLKTPVVGTCLTTGKTVRFGSQKEAALTIRPDSPGAGASITRAIKGRRPSAFGYVWSYDKGGPRAVSA